MPVTANNDSENIYFSKALICITAFISLKRLPPLKNQITFDENFAMGYWGKH